MLKEPEMNEKMNESTRGYNFIYMPTQPPIYGSHLFCLCDRMVDVSNVPNFRWIVFTVWEPQSAKLTSSVELTHRINNNVHTNILHCEWLCCSFVCSSHKSTCWIKKGPLLFYFCNNLGTLWPNFRFFHFWIELSEFWIQLHRKLELKLSA